MKNIWSDIAVPIGLLILFILAIWGLFNVMKSMAHPPTLKLESQDIKTTDSQAMIMGKTDPTAKVKVNNNTVAVAKDGSFSYTIKNLPEGLSVYSVSSQTNLAASTSKDVKITKTAVVSKLEQPAATTPTYSTGNGSALATSGPVEDVAGAFGLSAIILSLSIFIRSRRVSTLRAS